MISKSIQVASIVLSFLLFSLKLTAVQCPDAIPITSIPVNNQSLVCGTVNDLNGATVPGACGTATDSYKGGLEALYVWTPANSGPYQISYSGQTWSSILVYAGCPTQGGTCVGGIGSSASSKTLNVTLTAGTTYYIWFDTWPAPPSPCPGTFSINVPPPPPANDECVNAIAFPTIATNGTCSTVLVNTNNATQSQAGCIGTPNDDVWYSFTVPMGFTQINYSTSNISGSTDRVFQVWTACGGTSLFCSDPESGAWTGLTPGATYILRTYTWAANQNSIFNLCLSVPPPPPANDECVNAITWPTIPTNGLCANVTVSTLGATQSQIACTGTANDDVWYRFTVPMGSTQINYSTTNISGATDRVFQVWSACGGTSLFCSDPEAGSWAGLTPGATYILRVHTWAAGQSSVFNLCLSVPPPPPANDECVNAFELICALTAGTTIGATTTGNPGTCVTTMTSGTVWYTYQGNGQMVTINTCDVTGFDTKLFVFSGSCGNLTCVTGNDDFCGLRSQVSFMANMGTTYYIIVGGFNAAATGNFILNLSHPVNQTYYKDSDGDGFSDGTTIEDCAQPSGYYLASQLLATSGDCDDNNAAVNPAAIEICNGIDDNCDGNIDDVMTLYYADQDGDGFGDPNTTITVASCTPPAGYVTNNLDNCPLDANKIAPGICGCGVADTDTDGDGTADCIDGCPNDPNKTAPGQCGCGNPDTDTDGDGAADCIDGCPNDPALQAPKRWYLDADGDGFGHRTIFVMSCTQPTGYVADNTDCNDNNASINPNAVELCNGIDDNCDGAVDEGCTNPRMVVRGNGVIIANGDDTPAAADLTDYGVIVLNGNRVRSFTVFNTGSDPLTLTGTPRVEIEGPDAAHFTVTVMPAAQINPANNSQFQVRFDASMSGVFNAVVSISNNDINNNPYTFAIRATVNPGIAEVRGNNRVIENGDNTPTTLDFTDFGSRNMGQNLTRSFYLRNAGTGSLAVTGNPRVVLSGAGASHFSVLTQPVALITAGGSSLFRINYAPTAPGIHTATVTIESSDTGNSPYVFTIQGLGNGTNLVTPFETEAIAQEVEILTREANSEILSSTVYPNPVKDVLNVQFKMDDADKTAQMCIINMDGSMVLPYRFIQSGESVNVGELPAGVYLLQLKTENSVESVRFIKIN